MIALFVSLALAQAPAANATPPPAQAELSVVTAKQAPTFKLPGGKGTATLFHHLHNGAAQASMGVLSLEVGAEVPEHVHADSDELLYVIKGCVEMKIAGGLVSAAQGDAIRIPKGTPHSAKVPAKCSAPGLKRPPSPNAGLELVQVYAPAGPEQRFTQGEKVK